MRQIYKYQIIRYYPYSLSEEFINIGILLDGKCLNRIITEEEASMIHCSALIGDKKKFMRVVKHLNELSKKECLQDDYHYFNNFRYTEPKQVATDKKQNDVLEGLFYDYIGHKFPVKETLDTKQLIIQSSYNLIQKEFNKYLKVSKTNNKFDLEIENIKTQRKHHSVVGSVSNQQDISKIIMSAPAYKNRHPKDVYDFLDNAIRHRKQEISYKEKLKDNQIDYYDYVKEDDVVRYLEAIA